MPVSMNQIPANLYVPLFYAEMDNSAAFNFQPQYRALCVGMRRSSGLVSQNVLTLMTGGADQAIEAFGAGSQLAEMVRGFRENNDFDELWACAVDEPGAGAVAAYTVNTTGTATESGTLPLYVGGTLVEAGVTSGDDGSTVAAAVNAAIAADPNLPVSGAVSGTVTTLTLRHKGAYGNDLDLRTAYLGPAAGEAVPAGIGVNITQTVNGTSNPDLTATFAALGDKSFDLIVLPHVDATTLNDAKDEMDDVQGRWAWSRQLYGHCWAAARDSVADLQTLGDGRNDQHASIFGYADGPISPWRVAAQIAGASMRSLVNDPARPLQTIPIRGFLAPPESSRFTLSEMNTLLQDGISVLDYASDGTAQIVRAVTTYQENAYGQTDRSYLDVETLYTSAYVLRFLKARITQKFARVKLADDGTRFGPGQAIVTPSIIRAELIAAYRELEYDGLVENADLFAKYLIVERDTNNPNRVNVLFPPDHINQLRVFGLRYQFRLQYNRLTA